MSTNSGFFIHLCEQQIILPVLHAFLWVALLLNTASYFAVDQNSATEVVIGMNYVGIIVLLVASGLVLLKCRQMAKA